MLTKYPILCEVASPKEYGQRGHGLGIYPVINTGSLTQKALLEVYKVASQQTEWFFD